MSHNTDVKYCISNGHFLIFVCSLPDGFSYGCVRCGETVFKPHGEIQN